MKPYSSSLLFAQTLLKYSRNVFYFPIYQLKARIRKVKMVDTNESKEGIK